MDKVNHGPFPADHLTTIVGRAEQRGLIIKSMNTALKFPPPLIITEADIDEAVRILGQCLMEK